MEKVSINDINLRDLLRELLRVGFILEYIDDDNLMKLIRRNKRLYISTYHFTIYSDNNSISLDYKTTDIFKLISTILELIIISNNLDLL